MIIWLASYPRSGNTYLRFLIYSYFKGEINETSVVDDYVKDVSISNEDMFKDKSRIYYAKSHFMYMKRHPFLKDTFAVVHLVRNPRDVMLSAVRYNKLLANESIEALSTSKEQIFRDRAYAVDFISNGGDPFWKDKYIGTLFQNYNSWKLTEKKYPYIYLTYEYLKKNPHDALKKVLQLSESIIDDDKIDFAISQCHIANMKKMEKREKKVNMENPFCSELNTDIPFIGNGLSGQSLLFLGEDIEEMFKKKFNLYMKMLNYS